MKRFGMDYFIAAAMCAIIIFVMSSSAAAGIIYVKWNSPGSGAPPVYDGQSWDTAFHKVQDGVNASVTGDDIWVAAGTYAERITMKDGVALYGGFSGAETSFDQRDWTANHTILDGLGDQRSINTKNCPSSRNRLDGLRILDGGVYAEKGSLILSNDVILDGATPCAGRLTFTDVSNAAVVNTQITGVYARISAWAAKSVPQTASLTVDRVTITGASSGIWCQNQAVSITNSSITGGMYPGMDLRDTAGLVSGNTVEGCNGGIASINSSTYAGDSLTITGNTIRHNSFGDDGGGIYCQYSSARITNNQIVDNSAQGSGGGVFCTGSSSPVILGNTITGNWSLEYHSQISGYNGAGICCYSCSPTISENTIVNNGVDARSPMSRGGGIACLKCSAVITKNRIARNVMATAGGIYCDGPMATIEGNTVVDNRASLRGSGSTCAGGIYCTGGSTLVSNNVVAGNNARGLGGGVFCGGSTTLVNNTIVGNEGSGRGGGVWCYGGVLAAASNIVAHNSSGIWVSGTASVMTCRSNCAFGNAGGDYAGFPDPTGSNGNIALDPRLASTTYGNSHIQPGSPCIDAGDDSYVGSGWTDMDAQPRIQGAHVDIGADESDGARWPECPYAIVRVTPTGNDANDGSAWDSGHAKKTVQAAIDAAADKGGEVWVAAGTYPELVQLKSYAYLYGGFKGIETKRRQRDWTVNAAVLDGQQAGPVVTICAGYRTSGLDGFTIQNGVGDHGSGVACYSSVFISHNLVTGNSSGGIACNYSYSPVISENVIRENAGFAVFITDTVLPVITRNVIVGNTSRTAVWVEGIYMIPCPFCATITDNLIAGNGSGLFILGGGGSMVLRNNTVVANGGWGLAYTTCVDPQITNNIVAFNPSGVANNSTGGTFSGNCVYNPDGINYKGFPTDPTGTNGNISLDPLFRSAASGDYHLLWSSPCVDTGTNVGAPSTDLDGNPRPIDGNMDGLAVTDMGAYEFAPFQVNALVVPLWIHLQPNAVILVAIPSTRTFNAGMIDPTSVLFGPGRAKEIHRKGHFIGKGFRMGPELLLHFRCGDTGIKAGDTSVPLCGRLTTGEPFTATARIVVFGGRDRR